MNKCEQIESRHNYDFGVSVTGKEWELRQVSQRLIDTLMQGCDISETLATIIANRGVSDVQEALCYLEPKLKHELPDPFLLKDMDKAAKRIVQAMENGETITIFGDYDVDGATSSALLKRFFRHFDINVRVYIPHRIKEGYGPSVAAMDKIKKSGAKLVITVDCGVVSHEPLRHAHDIGLDVIVLDHHLSSGQLPKAVAIVNPNRVDDEFPFKKLAAVGVAFLTTVAVHSILKKRDIAKKYNNIDLLSFLDLVALGTVCDVMELHGLNRVFVHQGLKLIRKRSNIGIATLINVSGLNSVPKAHHLGFVIGPRINAGGRVGEGGLGAHLLSTEDPLEALTIAKQLDVFNTDRRIIENTVLHQAIATIENKGLDALPVIMVYGQEWHLGILGIIASKLKERYGKPAAAISLQYWKKKLKSFMSF